MATPSHFHGDGGHLAHACAPSNASTPYKIFVHIIEARGLISGDKNHLSDALCIVELGPTLNQRRETSIEEKTMNAVWDQVFMFDDVELTEDELQSEKLSLAVLHKSDFVRNKMIGVYEFTLGNIYRQNSHQYYRRWLPLTVPEKPENEDGSLLVTVYVLGPNDPTPLPEVLSPADNENDENAAQTLQSPAQGDKKMHLLNVLIYKAEDVLLTQYGGPDALVRTVQGAKDIGVSPFVSAGFNQNKLLTSAAPSDSLDRTWNRRFEFPYSLPLTSDSIEVTLWNKRTVGADDVIGRQLFNFFQMGLSHKSWGPRWVNFYSADFASPHETTLGQFVKSVIKGQQKSTLKHEYVGRLLMRMSTAQVEEAVCSIQQCAPALPPKSDDYTLQFILHSTSELAVQGGFVQVELVFGVHRIQSEWVSGKPKHPGVFEFNEKFPPISCNIPDDRSQVYHIFINVYYRYGDNKTKIAYERIPVVSLFPQGAEKSGYIYINGETRLTRASKLPAWPTKWRPLTNLVPDPKKVHVPAGFLSCSLGFGLKRDFPSQHIIPAPIKSPQYTKYSLRVYLHQAANLLPALKNGCSNPFLVIRYNGRTLEFECSQKNTLFPLWFECKVLEDLYLDIVHAPSVYIMVLQKTTFGFVTIGRAEIATDHILKNKNKLCRYRLKFDQDLTEDEGGGVPGASPAGANSLPVNSAGFPIIGGAVHTGKNLSDYLLSANASKSSDDYEPYVLASFELFPSKERDLNPIDPDFPPKLKDFVVKVEAIGLRELESSLSDASLQPELEIAVPKLTFQTAITPMPSSTTRGGVTKRQEEEKEMMVISPPGGPSSSDDYNEKDRDKLPPPIIKWEKQTPQCSGPRGQGIQVLNTATFTRVALPVTDPYSFPLRIRLLNAGSSKPKHCYCSRFIPISDLLDSQLHFSRPPTYRYTGSGSNSTEHDASIGQGSMQSGGLIGTGQSIAQAEDDEQKTSDAATSSSRAALKSLSPELNDIPREYEGLVLHVEEEVSAPEAAPDDEEGGPSTRLTAKEDPFILDLDLPHLNVGPGSSSAEVRITNEWRNDGAVTHEAKETNEDGETNDEMVTVEEETGPPPKPKLRMLSLFRNKENNQIGPKNILESCILKAYCRCRALPESAREVDKMLNELDRDNLIQPLKSIYDKTYVARCYIYNGINLAPLSSFLASSQSSNPYLVAANGPGMGNHVSYDAKAKKDDLNPDFYIPFDLPTNVPDNYKLELSVWNKHGSGLGMFDSLIGTVWIDLENRLIQQKEAERQAKLDGLDETPWKPTTEYHDLKKESTRTSQGKLSLKIEMLTEEEARRIKPDDLVAPTTQEYELRMVIWNTRDVRFPVDSDADGAVDDVNQRIIVTTNFGHRRGHEIVKQTDVAWNSTNGRAQWFHRMKWRLKLPAKLPRIKIAMWNETVMTDNLLIGECLYNLAPLFARAQKDKLNITKVEQEWVEFIHPLYRDVTLGSVQVEFSLLTETEADKSPVGEAQEEPNRDPFLAPPDRNPPPWAIGTKGLNALGRWKKLIMFLIIAIVTVGVAVGLIIPLVAVV